MSRRWIQLPQFIFGDDDFCHYYPGFFMHGRRKLEFVVASTVCHIIVWSSGMRMPFCSASLNTLVVSFRGATQVRRRD